MRKFRSILLVIVLLSLILAHLPGTMGWTVNASTGGGSPYYNLSIYQSATTGMVPITVNFQASVTIYLPPNPAKFTVESETNTEPVVNYSNPNIQFIKWGFGDGTSTSGSLSVDHTYTSAGTFNVNCTVSMTNGISLSKNTTVTVTAPLGPTSYEQTYEFGGWPWYNLYTDISDMKVSPSGLLYTATKARYPQYPSTFNDIGVYVFSRYGAYYDKIIGYGTYYTQLQGTQALAVDSQGYVYVADGPTIKKYSGTHLYMGGWGGAGTGPGQFQWITSMTIDKNNILYVMDSGARMVSKFDLNGNFLARWSTGPNPGYSDFQTIAVNSIGNVYICGRQTEYIYVFNPAGGLIGNIGGHGSQDGQFYLPAGIAIDQYDALYVADSFNNRVQKFDRYHRFMTKMLMPQYTPYFVQIYQDKVYVGAGLPVNGILTVQVKEYTPVY